MPKAKLTAYWPEAAAIALYLVLLAALHVPVVIATVLAVVGYASLRWIASSETKGEGAAQSDDYFSTLPTVEQLFRQLREIQSNSKLAPFAPELSGLISTVQNGLLIVPKPSQDPSVRELTRVTLDQAVLYTRQIATLPVAPGIETPVSSNYRALLRQSADELNKSYSATNLKNNAALAEQIESSSQALQTLHQQMRSEDA